MSEIKPRIRIASDGTIRSINGVATGDSYQNFLASVGMGTRNAASGSTYGLRLLTRERLLLEWMYRGSWICGVAVDAVADDMVKQGVDFSGGLPPKESEALDAAMITHQLWAQLNEMIRWGRLYGGCIAVIMIDGQDVSTPLRLETVGRDQFKGLCVLDRWMVEPSLNDLVSDAGPDLGLPKFYKITSGVAPVGAAVAPALLGQMVHYSRCFRYIGVDLPWWQRVSENLWGMSIYERLWDRLTAFDSTTQGIAQLVYRAYLRVVKLADLRQAGAMSPEAQAGLARRIEIMTRFQTNEGITLLGAEDDFQVVSYAFAGLNDVLLGMGQQLGGALQMPLTRLFAQSPAGLNATGDSDWRNYYDGIHQQQELRLRRPLTRALKCLARSEAIKLPDTFHYAFRPMWQLLPKEKAELAESVTRTVLSADELGIISHRRTLEELRQQSRESGIWATITDEEIEAAEDELPAAPGMPGTAVPGVPGGPGAETEGEPGQQEGAAPGGQQPGGKARLPVPLPTVHLRGTEAA
jgi:phage-related protein (TIGR01555 family)